MVESTRTVYDRVIRDFCFVWKIFVWATVFFYDSLLFASPIPNSEEYHENLARSTIVIANLASDDSVELARFYAKERSIPFANIIYISCPDTESVTWKVFAEKIYNPIQVDLVSRGWIRGTILPETDLHGRYKIRANQLKVSYLVTTRGVPYKIKNAPEEVLKDSDFSVYDWKQTHTSSAALDTELSFLAVNGSPVVSVVKNPYFERSEARQNGDFIIKTSRIDGPDLSICKRIIMDSIEVEQSENRGRAFVDLGGPDPEGDDWLNTVVETLEHRGICVDIEESKRLAGSESDLSNLSFYFGWYAQDIGGGMDTKDASLLPGSVAFHIHSFSGKIRNAEKGWTGPLLAKGASVSVGNVNEPYLQFTHRPDLLIKALCQGWNVGDAMAYALPMLSWQAMHIGDPLYRPFGSKH